MILRDIISRSGRSLKSAKARTLLTALAIAVGAFALTLTLAASNGATKYVNKIISENFDPAELLVGKDEAIFGRGDNSKPKEYDVNYSASLSRAGANTQVKQLDENDLSTIKALTGVAAVRENITVNLQYITRPGQKKYIGNAQAFSPYSKPDVLAGTVNGAVKDKHILLPEGYLSGLGFTSPQDAIGKTVTLAVAKPVTSVSPFVLAAPESVLTDFTVQAVTKRPTTAQPGTELYMYVNLDDARILQDISTGGTSSYHKYTYVFVKVANGTDQKALIAVQDTLKAKGYVAQSVKDTQQTLTSFIAVLQGIVAGFGLIAIIASVFGVVNTMYISVLQRTREIGLMKALGMRKRDIGRLFRFEAAWIGFLGGLIGSMLAVGLGIVLNPWITTKLDLGKGTSLLVFQPMQVGMLIVILMAISILAGWLPSRKAAKLDPIEALRTE